jgi:quinate dehydrogenase
MATVPVDMAPLVSQASQLDRHGYLFGLKISASMSPLLHKTIYQELGLKWEQQLFESSDISEFLELIKDPSFYGEQPSCPA